MAPRSLATTVATGGTTAIVVATAASAVAVYVYEVIAGRALGATAFAPVGMIWTIGFLGFTVVLIPVEQFVTRQLVLAGGDARHLGHAARTILLVAGSVTVVLAGFVALTRERFFEGSWAFVGVAALLAIDRALLAVGRGFLAGRRRFHAYGVAIAAEAGALVALGIVAALLRPTAVAFSLAMALAPLAVLVTRPFRPSGSSPVGPEATRVGVVGFLGWFVVANAASQLVLAGGPIFVGLLGGTAAAISVYFITFTLFRGPMTSSYNLLARVLPDFTELARTGAHARLRRWALLLGLGGLVLALAFAAGAAVLGPWIVAFLYGAEFAPSRLVAALGAAGVGFGLAGLFVAQVFVARGATRRLAAAWLVAVVVAGLTMFVAPGAPIERVAAAFVAGEGAALAGLVLLAVVGDRR
ncbi:MAG TPA: hypothetical protein ENK55_12480 [Actinobacteria bacterium]|nr:hypothetical protein [Actinomycetota bacterium]